MENNYVTVPELAKVVFGGKISVAALYRLVKTGEIPSIKLGKKYLIPVNKIKEKYETV